MRNFADPMPFSPQYDFQVHRAFRYEGLDYKGGDPFPAEGVERPAATLLQKLYNQKRITVMAPPAEGLQPGYVQTANEVAARKEAERLRLAEEARLQHEQVKAESGDTDNDADETDGAADDAADQTGAGATQPGSVGGADEQSGDAGLNGHASGPGITAEGAPETGQAAQAFVAPYRRFFTGGFKETKHQVLDANGLVFKSGLEKNEAEDMAARLNAAADPDAKT